jgi:hypothetical protein
MIELLKAIDDNRRGDVPFSQDVRLGKAFSDWLWNNTDARYVAQSAAAVAVAARCNISLSSLYRARAAYLAQLTRRSRR